MKQTTIIVVTWNEEARLKACADELERFCADAQIIYVDNGSTDQTASWLSGNKAEYVVFDEGIQPMGKVLNAVIDNFSLREKIVLLRPKYRLGEHTIERMIHALDTEEQVGIVGACYNRGLGEQQIEIAELQQLYKVEQERKDERLCYTLAVSGGCYGMKRSLIEEVGYFTESLATMDVMMDYQLRAVKKGYLNCVATSACLFDEGEMEEQKVWWDKLHSLDYEMLTDTWKMTYFTYTPHYVLVDKIAEAPDAHFRVLEVGCDLGANLLGVKNRFPNAEVYGVEINKNAAEIAGNILDIRWGNIEDESLDFDVKFDYIIFGDVLEHLHNPQKTIKYCRSLLAKNGRIIASIPNVMHVSVMAQLLRGEFCYTEKGLLDKTHIHLFTGQEIEKMFYREKYEIENMLGIIYPIKEEEKELVQKLLQISDSNVVAANYETFQYLVIAKMTE